MHSGNRGDRQEFQREVAVRHGVDRIAGWLTEAERLGRHVAIDRIAGTGKGCRADRALVQMFDRMAHALTVAAEHLDIGHAVMAEGHRLGGLEMGEAGHHRVGMFFGAVEEGSDQAAQGLFGLLQLFLDPEAEVERHLVVTRAGRVQAAGGRADQVGKPRLDVHMNVFELARKDELASLDL
ncbi:hypothetical protein PDO_3222 [Rhizobium sp. PDO1-076]|nr:hypothetical protein PDO_3222 [Rhizobium sp. PDO1-076]